MHIRHTYTNAWAHIYMYMYASCEVQRAVYIFIQYSSDARYNVCAFCTCITCVSHANRTWVARESHTCRKQMHGCQTHAWPTRVSHFGAAHTCRTRVERKSHAHVARGLYACHTQIVRGSHANHTRVASKCMAVKLTHGRHAFHILEQHTRVARVLNANRMRMSHVDCTRVTRKSYVGRTRITHVSQANAWLSNSRMADTRFTFWSSTHVSHAC